MWMLESRGTVLWGIERSREGERDHHSPGAVSEAADKPATDSLQTVEVKQEFPWNPLVKIKGQWGDSWGSRAFQSDSEGDPLKRRSAGREQFTENLRVAAGAWAPDSP